MFNLSVKEQIQEFINQLEKKRRLDETYVYIDMDAFFASIEELTHPEYKDKPFAVGHKIICSANYIARSYGIRSAMPTYEALKLCPSLILMPPNTSKYQNVNLSLRAIFEKFDPGFAMLSIDEACLRIDHVDIDVINDIKNEILHKTGLTCSIGVAPNMRLAKMCSSINKPNGYYILENDRDCIIQFLHSSPITRINGIGKQFSKKLKKIGIEKCGDIGEYKEVLYEKFNRETFLFLMRSWLGIWDSKMTFKERKSIGCQITFTKTSDLITIYDHMLNICQYIEGKLRKKKKKGRKVSLHLKIGLKLYCRDHTRIEGFYEAHQIFKYAKELYKEFKDIKIRMIGIRIGDLYDVDHDKRIIKMIEHAPILEKSNNHNDDYSMNEQTIIKSNNKRGLIDIHKREKIGILKYLKVEDKI